VAPAAFGTGLVGDNAAKRLGVGIGSPVTLAWE